MPPYLRLNVINAATFPVQRCYRRFISGSTGLTLPFFRLNAVTPLFFLLNAVYAAIFPVKCHYCRYFSGSTPLTQLVFGLNAINAGISPVQRR